MAVKLSDLPCEVISRIYSFLPPREIGICLRVCKALCAASYNESLWKELCAKDYGIHHLSCEYFSYRDVYTSLLHPYGSLIGLWKSEVYPYGGLLTIKYESGCLNAYEVYPPRNPNIMQDVRLKRLFTISIGANKQPYVYCCGGQRGPHEAKIYDREVDRFSFQCRSLTRDGLADLDPNNHSSVLYNWLSDGEHPQIQDGPEAVLYLELLFVKFFRISTYNHNYTYEQIVLPSKTKDVPIQPGIFKGTYSSHGVEFILLTYDDHMARATKISGDPNVPAGEMTFEVNLSHHMVLTLDQQDTLDHLAEIEVGAACPEDDRPCSQQVRVPIDCIVRFQEVPTMCISRYHGQGQIAHDGFSNPSFTPGHWIIFNEDLFGFLWIELSVLSMYYRAKEIS